MPRASARASDRAARCEKIPVAHQVMPNSSRLATTNCTNGLAQGRRRALTRRSFPWAAGPGSLRGRSGQSVTARSARGQYEMVPRQTCPPWVARKVKWSFPERFAIRRFTSNDPLRPAVLLGAPGRGAAVVLEPPVPDLAGPVAVDLALDLDPPVVGLGLELPVRAARAAAARADVAASPVARRWRVRRAPTGRVSAATAMAARAVRVTMSELLGYAVEDTRIRPQQVGVTIGRWYYDLRAAPGFSARRSAVVLGVEDARDLDPAGAAECRGRGRLEVDGDAGPGRPRSR